MPVMWRVTVEVGGFRSRESDLFQMQDESVVAVAYGHSSLIDAGACGYNARCFSQRRVWIHTVGTLYNFQPVYSVRSSLNGTYHFLTVFPFDLGRFAHR